MKIRLHNSYNADIYLDYKYMITDNEVIFLLVVNDSELGDNIMVIYEDNSYTTINAISPPGGPMLTIGMLLDHKYVINEIFHKQGEGFYIRVSSL